MNVFEAMRELIEETLAVALEEAGQASVANGAAFSVEPPRDPRHGEVSSNVALVRAKAAGMKPRDLAERVAGALAGHEDVLDASVAGPGFINLRLRGEVWRERLREILVAGTA